jgi:hypothetical protein
VTHYYIIKEFKAFGGIKNSTNHPFFTKLPYWKQYVRRMENNRISKQIL